MSIRELISEIHKLREDIQYIKEILSALEISDFFLTPEEYEDR